MSLAQTRHRLVLAAFCSGWLAVGFATSAFASTCSHIQAELARLAPAGKWSEAAARQRQALALAERDARYLGCGGASAQPSCGALTKKIASMRANLAKIERQRDRSGGGAAAQRRRLEKAFAANGCGSRMAGSRPDSGTNNRAGTITASSSGRPIQPAAGTGLFALFGAHHPAPQAPAAPAAIQARRAAAAPQVQGSRSRAVYAGSEEAPMASRFGSGSYRTLCVRSCDGFFFPVSFSTSKQGFSRDEAICRSMCPAAETRLYVHRNPGETVDDMVSLEGVPYAQSENAFLFKTKYVDACTCQGDPGERRTMASLIRSGDDEATGYLRAETLTPGLDITSLRTSLAPVPTEPPIGADPDTEMNVRLGYATEAAAPTLPAAEPKPAAVPQPQTALPAPTTDGDKRPVRIVGPRYFVAQ